MSLSYTDAANLMHSKILVQKVYLEQLKMEREYSHKLVELQHLCMKTLSEKEEISKKIIASMESQLSNFDEVKQLETNSLMEDLNAVNQPSPQVIKLMKECDELASGITTSMKRIEYLESLIPKQQQITNYNAKLKEDTEIDLVE